jgi:hypothetical protein
MNKSLPSSMDLDTTIPVEVWARILRRAVNHQKTTVSWTVQLLQNETGKIVTYVFPVNLPMAMKCRFFSRRFRRLVDEVLYVPKFRHLLADTVSDNTRNSWRNNIALVGFLAQSGHVPGNAFARCCHPRHNVMGPNYDSAYVLSTALTRLDLSKLPKPQRFAFYQSFFRASEHSPLSITNFNAVWYQENDADIQHWLTTTYPLEPPGQMDGRLFYNETNKDWQLRVDGRSIVGRTMTEVTRHAGSLLRGDMRHLNLYVDGLNDQAFNSGLYDYVAHRYGKQQAHDLIPFTLSLMPQQ